MPIPVRAVSLESPQRQEHVDDHNLLSDFYNKAGEDGEAVANKLAESVNVGAPGGSDDASAFSTALAAIGAGGKVVLQPGSTYSLSTTVDITKPFELVGNGSEINLASSDVFRVNASNVTVRGVTFTHSAPGNPARRLLDATKTVADDHHHWRFIGCVFDEVTLRATKIGRTNNDGTTATEGTDLASNIDILYCEFKNAQTNYAIELAGVDDALVFGGHIHDHGVDGTEGDGIKVLAGSTGVKIVLPTIERCTRDGIDFFDSSGTVVEHCLIRDCEQWGIEAKWNSTNDANEPTEAHITNNRVLNSGSGGINGNMHRSIITGNHVEGSGAQGIRFAVSGVSGDSTEYATIANNVLIGNAGDGITISGNLASVTGNIALDNGTFGIIAGSDSENCFFDGNICFGNTTAGLRIGGTGHTLGLNTTQDSGGSVVVSGTNITRNAYGEVTSTPSAGDWPVGVVIHNTTDGKLRMRLPAGFLVLPSLGALNTWTAKQTFSAGLAARVVATASLPAAGASMDGEILIEDNGTGDRNLIVYAGTQRFRIDGGAAF